MENISVPFYDLAEALGNVVFMCSSFYLFFFGVLLTVYFEINLFDIVKFGSTTIRTENQIRTNDNFGPNFEIRPKVFPLISVIT